MMKKRKILQLNYCARGGSKRIKRKNLRTLDGNPLIGRVIMHALSSEKLDTVLVTTDDKEIADIAVSYGAEVPFLRPKHLSEDLVLLKKLSSMHF